MCVYVYAYLYDIYRIDFLGKGYDCFKVCSSIMPVIRVSTVVMWHKKTVSIL